MILESELFCHPAATLTAVRLVETKTHWKWREEFCDGELHGGPYQPNELSTESGGGRYQVQILPLGATCWVVLDAGEDFSEMEEVYATSREHQQAEITRAIERVK